MPFSGISGDMFLGALTELVPDGDQLLQQIAVDLNLQNTTVSVQKVTKCGISATKVEINSPPTTDHRDINNILSLIQNCPYSDQVKAFSTKVIKLLGAVEAQIHNVPIEKLHFHEIGAVDTIIDIIGAAILLEKLNISTVMCGPVCTGFGMVKCEHGPMPIPAPATMELLKNIPTYQGKIEAELTTPTGAAILSCLEQTFCDKEFVAQKISYGAGFKDFSSPNCLRLALGKIHSKTPTNTNLEQDEICVIQSNIDDMSSELLGSDFQNELFNQGALDVSLTPMTMKKGRAAIKLEVQCHKEFQAQVINYILTNTSAIGLRHYFASRVKLPRTKVSVETKYGQVKAKKVILPTGNIRIIPEFESCKAQALQHNVSVIDVYRLALTTC